MAQALKDRNTAGNDPGFDRRKAKRLFLNFSVEISGVDEKGQPFTDRTKTDDISATGCQELSFRYSVLKGFAQIAHRFSVQRPPRTRKFL